MNGNGFKFFLGQLVSLAANPLETGTVIGRAEYQNNENNYLVRYRASDGRVVEQWWGESAFQ